MLGVASLHPETYSIHSRLVLMARSNICNNFIYLIKYKQELRKYLVAGGSI